ncbi:MAG: cell division protein FtsQ [Bacteroidota bacterium]
MWVKVKKYQVIGAVVIAVLMMITISFSERNLDNHICQDIIIRIENQHENFFLGEQDVMDLITVNGEYVIKGTPYEDLNLKEIEGRIKTQRFIKEAEIYKDLKGNLLVNTALRRPFARILIENAPDYFIAEDGAILPYSSKYATRTVLLSGDYMDELVKQDLTESETGRKVYDLLKFIHNDRFWKAQVAQLDIDKEGEIIIYPQVTKQLVEFGLPENIENKFKRLRIFYKQILPRKGWNGYKRVNLKYKDQIIAE